jgi:spermidine synthase
MLGKMLLPLAGGTPAIWTTCVLFFQLVLLAGYAYSHVSSRLLGRRQPLLHMLVILLPLLALPIALPHGWLAPVGSSPIPWLLAVLGVAVGVPFFVLSTSGPLLQQWFSRTAHPDAADPYFLYRASNLGSMLALLAYPTLVEPHLGLLAQSRAWAVGYLALLPMSAGCALVAWRSRPPQTSDAAASPRPAVRPDAGLTTPRRLRWLVLAAVPSTWMLAVTAYFTNEVRPIPLLWIAPLALYLLSVAVAFARRPLVSTALLGRIFPFLALPLLGLIIGGARGPLWAELLVHLFIFFWGSLLCHSLLAGDRPAPSHLTEFYLWIALGGVAGGAFSSVLAPVLFNDYLEYPLAVVGACLLRPSLDGQSGRRSRILDLALPAGLGVCLAGVSLLLAHSGVISGLSQQRLSAGASMADPLRLVVVFAVPAVAAVVFSGRALRFGLTTGLMIALNLLPLWGSGTLLYVQRDFFGVHRVVSEAGGNHLLIDGATIHGVQSTDSAHRDEPMAYYNRSGPLGDVFAATRSRDAQWQVAAVGLGAGAAACYARPEQRWTFYEIDPAIERIARDPALFTYLSDCLGDRGTVKLGDGRLSLARAPDAAYGLIILDAFGSDAIPVHLLTLDAIQMYLRKLGDGGILAFHISNAYADLSSVLANEAAASGLVAYQRIDSNVDPGGLSSVRYPSQWLVMARQAQALEGLPQTAGWERLEGRRGAAVWTDDFSNVLSVTRLR